MRAHILRHVPFESLGNIEPWLVRRNATLTETRFWESYSLPDPADIDLLIVLGGPMSVNDEATRPWLVQEKAFIRDVVSKAIPTLGICLGSQLIASAHGAGVRRNEFAEHGWFVVEGIRGPVGAFAFPARFTPFHSHGETFALPDGAVHLARSVACEHQAFQLGERCLAIQFHLESSAESAGAIVEECSEGYPSGPYVQSKDELRIAPANAIERSASIMETVLDYLVR